MDTLEAFKNRIYTLKLDAYKHDVLLPFYTIEQQEIIKHCFKKKDDVQVYFYGGYENAEYKRALISINTVSSPDFNIITLKINYNNKTDTISHRQILGSILALGLKREVIGDIIKVSDDYYFFAVSNMKEFIIDNLHYIGKAKVEIEQYFEKLNYEIEYAERIVFLPSMRLDNVLANSYNLGRKKAKEIVEAGLVKVNHLIVTNTTKIIKENDVLSVRGKGRLIVGQLVGKSKSDNLILKIRIPR